MAAHPDERPRCRLYLITPSTLPDLKAFARTLGDALGAGDVACLQLRLKGADDAAVTLLVQMCDAPLRGRREARRR